MLFGLACEGVTDQITIENILCGYFGNPDLDADITQLQPPFDETDQKQKGGGGWTMLLQNYLSTQRFRQDVLYNQFIIIQVDTDVSNEKGFDVPQVDADNQPLTSEVLINHVIAKLIAIIDRGETGFYQRHSEKIIFCISVHSLECWLVAHHAEQSAIHDCFEVLKIVINPNVIRVAKKQRNYKKLSEPFLDRINIDAVVKKDYSFRVFIQALATIEEQVYKLNDVR